MPHGLHRLLLGLLMVCVATSAANAKPPRYAGMLANGQRIEGNSLHDWHDIKTRPRLEGQALLDPSNPLRWLRDRTLRPADLPAAYIELHTGDRLPGVVTDARSGQEETWNPLPAHLVVQPSIALEPPHKTAPHEIRVATSFVRRVIWQRSARQAYRPGTVFYRDGRSMAFRAVRFGSGHVNVLLPEGNRKIPWSDLAEVHLPAIEVWQSYFQDLAGMCLSGQSRLMQVETSGGLVATAALDRLVPRFEGNPSESQRWVHGIQPAWSLDLLWIPCRDMVYRRSFAPHEVPLSRIVPESSQTRSALGGSGRGAQVNRSALGAPLRSATLDFGWGFGVQSRSELRFTLPAGVKSLRTWGAIDHSSGKGGCLKFRVFGNEATGSPLWESPLLVGSEQVVDSGPISLTGPPQGLKSIILQVDPAAAARPPGADPLDIRDNADWLDPLLELDPAVVRAAIDKRLPQQIAAWRDWSVRMVSVPGASDNAGLEFSSTREERQPHQPPASFETAVNPQGQALSLSRSIKIGPDDHWLVIAASRFGNRAAQPKIEVRFNGEEVAEHVLQEGPQSRPEFRPLAIPLTPYQRPGGARVEVEIRQLAAAAPPVQWRAIQVVDQLPTLYRIFEEQVAALVSSPSPPSALSSDDHYYGERSLSLQPEMSFRLALPRKIAIRERPEWGEYRFVRFAFRKRGGGQIALDLETSDLRPQPARYDAGPGKPAFGIANRVWQDQLGKDWIVMTRDLYADFGNLDLRSVSLACLGGEQANFDHLYLGRSHEDFNLIAAAPSPQVTNDKARLELARPVIERTLPALVAVRFLDGRQTGGALIRREGEILIAGHLSPGANREVQVTLGDTRVVKAKTLGISRDFDLALMKIVDAGEWPAAPVSDQKEIDFQQPLMALVWPENIVAGAKPEAQVANLRRLFRSAIWTDAERTGWSAGGVLLNSNGQLSGLHVGRSSFGGFVYTRLFNSELEPHLNRMRNGEVWGAWPEGSQPSLQLEVKEASPGLLIKSVASEGSAAKAGLRAGDILVRFDGLAMLRSDDLQRSLAAKDAGAEVAVEFLRAGAAQQVKMTLSLRIP